MDHIGSESGSHFGRALQELTITEGRSVEAHDGDEPVRFVPKSPQMLVAALMAAAPLFAQGASAQITLPTTGQGPYHGLAPDGGRPFLSQRGGNVSFLYDQEFLRASHNSDYLTLQQARAAHLDDIADHFAAIDVRNQGRITLSDPHTYLDGQPGYMTDTIANSQILAPTLVTNSR